MSYVSPNGPLPPNNSQIRIPCAGPGSLETGVCNSADVEAATLEGKARIRQTSSPCSFVPLGLPVAKQVQQAQLRMTGQPSSQAKQRGPAMRPPTVVPLNVTEEEFNGCCRQTITTEVITPPPPRIQIAPAPIPVPVPHSPEPLYIPPPVTVPYMPPVATPQAVAAPSYVPSNVIQRPAVISGGPVRSAPGLTVGRFYSVAPSGMRGLGSVWGDKGSTPCGGTWRQPPTNSASTLAVLLAAGIAAAFAFSGRR